MNFLAQAAAKAEARFTEALNKVDQARRELEVAEKGFRDYQKAERAKTADSLAPSEDPGTPEA